MQNIAVFSWVQYKKVMEPQMHADKSVLYSSENSYIYKYYNRISYSLKAIFIMSRKIVVGVMGPGEQAKDIDIQNAYEIGKQIAREGWVLLTGGRNVGVMEAANQGAKAANGLTVGILPGKTDEGISEAVDIAIFTDLGNARNNINVLSADVVIACGMGAGTASEIALALKTSKKVILLSGDEESQIFFQKMSPRNVYVVSDVENAIATTHIILSASMDKQTF
jgi:uncharacterized protein (TIGR00725 family)